MRNSTKKKLEKTRNTTQTNAARMLQRQMMQRAAANQGNTFAIFVRTL